MSAIANGARELKFYLRWTLITEKVNRSSTLCSISAFIISVILAVYLILDYIQYLIIQVSLISVFTENHSKFYPMGDSCMISAKKRDAWSKRKYNTSKYRIISYQSRGWIMLGRICIWFCGLVLYFFVFAMKQLRNFPIT